MRFSQQPIESHESIIGQCLSDCKQGAICGVSPVTDKISDMSLQPFDIIQFKSRLKYKPKIGNTIYVYQARDIERIGTFVSSEEEVINKG